MKNSTVEVMIRNQFNIKDEIKVNVDFLCVISDNYHFEVWWVDAEDVHHQVNCILPQLTLNERKLGENS